MDELLIEVRDQLEICNLARETRLNLMNRNSSKAFLVCFMLVSDRFENLDQLLIAIQNCLSDMNIIISRIKDNKISILPA
ncbi:hypothetical protein Celal_3614 [Cellulophaga algicola DSM 14237]|uniref:Uncharacterized protein n=1 Tax=Cellulophaga algicola (strain DSM 14237 / IC166 / ACAM 630) TaxID=688270 RepID=E6X959_CELAD|nr:hypothetical protein Celal_3614 [Cellulophaga algicola DSM 14237]